MEKLLMKNIESFSKKSKTSNILAAVTFKIGERIATSSPAFVVMISTSGDKVTRDYTNPWKQERYIYEYELNADVYTLISQYEDSIPVYYRITVQLRYEVGNEQLAVIAVFDTKEKAENYINNLWNFIIGKFA